MSESANRKARLTARRAIGVAGVVVGLVLLGACASDPGLSTSAYVPPSPPTQGAIVSAATSLANDAKLVGSLEVSPVRPSDHGPGSYVVCLREANPPPDKGQRYYAMFFDNDSSKGARLSVMVDACETQTFSPVPVTATAPAKAPKTAGPKVRRGSAPAR